jgi:hypothetical protein
MRSFDAFVFYEALLEEPLPISLLDLFVRVHHDGLEHLPAILGVLLEHLVP